MKNLKIVLTSLVLVSAMNLTMVTQAQAAALFQPYGDPTVVKLGGGSRVVAIPRKCGGYTFEPETSDAGQGAATFTHFSGKKCDYVRVNDSSTGTLTFLP